VAGVGSGAGSGFQGAEAVEAAASSGRRNDHCHEPAKLRAVQILVEQRAPDRPRNGVAEGLRGLAAEDPPARRGEAGAEAGFHRAVRADAKGGPWQHLLAGPEHDRVTTEPAPPPGGVSSKPDVGRAVQGIRDGDATNRGVPELRRELRHLRRHARAQPARLGERVAQHVIHEQLEESEVVRTLDLLVGAVPLPIQPFQPGSQRVPRSFPALLHASLCVPGPPAIDSVPHRCTLHNTRMDAIFASAYGPIVIFLLRIVDVSLATLRMLMIMRGRKTLAPLIGSVEVLVWIFAVGHAIRHIDSAWHLIGYAGGFATGTWVGLQIEEKLALGMSTVRIFSRHGGVEIAEALRERGFGVTEFAGQGREGRVEMVYVVARRRELPSVMEQVRIWDSDAFVTVEEPKAIQRGWMFSSRRK
jgi:uncharacterized protein YebE (UPF0316 family)